MQVLPRLRNCIPLSYRYTKDDSSYVPQVLSLIYSTDLRCVAITHRVEDQTVEATIRQLEALDPKIQDVLARPALWGLRSFGWKVLCKEPPTDAQQQKWQRVVAPFLQVMADRNVLLLRVAGAYLRFARVFSHSRTDCASLECPKGVQ